MGQQVQIAQNAAASRRWLSMLIEAMEEAARTELPESACGPEVPAGLSLQLEQSRLTSLAGASHFTLCN
jgi:hypothetical protein